MDIGIIWGLLCLVFAVALLLIFVVRRNQAQAKETRAAWHAAHPALPQNNDMGMALMWTGVICAGGATGVLALPRFVTAPDIFSGLGFAFALWTVIAGTYFVLRRTWL